MWLGEAFRVAADNLLRHRLRTALTMLGIVFGVAAVLAMVSIGAGAESEALSVIRNMGLRNVIVKAKDFEPKEMAAIRQDSPGLTLRDAEALRKALAPGTLLAGKKQLKTFQVFSRVGRTDSRVVGVQALYPGAVGLSVSQGAFFLPFDDDKARPVCVLGTTARRKLFGINDPLGEAVKINHEWFTVIGTLEDRFIGKDEFEGVKIDNANDDVYIPLGSLKRRFGQDPVQNELDEIVIQVPESVDLRDQAAVVSSLVASMHRQVDDFRLVVPEKLLQQKQKTQRIFDIVMGAIASISLLVGGIGIMNIMLASVLERTNEIGLRRALGARRRDISRQFLLESVTITVLGSAAGIALGYGISRAVAGYSGWTTVITPWSVLLSVGVSSAVGLVFGLYPARQAASISPIEALRRD
ncbi:MAG: ABC transporter permease [Acidobacteria bacterium]|nr:ABC transporter permease [Acidobacteriota bacterium]